MKLTQMPSGLTVVPRSLLSDDGPGQFVLLTPFILGVVSILIAILSYIAYKKFTFQVIVPLLAASFFLILPVAHSLTEDEYDLGGILVSWLDPLFFISLVILALILVCLVLSIRKLLKRRSTS